MRVTVIDLGTNTFNLLIAEVEKGNIQTLFKTKVAVKLGEKSIQKNLISKEAIKRAINTLTDYKKISQKFNSSTIVAVATSAVRNAKNKNVFIKEVEKFCGIKIRVINGEQEANYIFKGVNAALKIEETPALIVDIGGGSNEFIIAQNGKALWKKSLDIGAARIIAKFNPEDPISESTIQKMEEYYSKEMHEVFENCKNYEVNELIGSSGSFDTFAEIIEHKKGNAAALKNTNSYEFNIKEYFDVHAYLIASTKAERENTEGLIAMRVDMIVVASVFVNFILSQITVNRFRLSTYSLKEGVINEISLRPNRFYID